MVIKNKFLRDLFDLDVIEGRYEAIKFVIRFGDRYLFNDDYEQEDVVDAINEVMTRINKIDHKLVHHILQQLKIHYPKVHKTYKFGLLDDKS